MSLGDALLTFVSVFVAALLAFYLDGLRERRAAKAWVTEYLGFWRDTLVSAEGDRAGGEETLDQIDRAFDQWLEPPEKGSGPDWSFIDTVNVHTAVSFTPLLLSAGARSVPAELLRQMFIADATVPALVKQSESVASKYESLVLPLRLAQVVDLAPQDRRTVEYFRAEFQGMRRTMRSYLDLLDKIREELLRLGY